MRPYEHLPHRHPFVMLDSADITEEGKTARGIKRITSNDMAVHGGDSLPQAYLLEAMAQISGIASSRKGGSMLAGLRDIRFSGTAYVGDTLELESTLERTFSGLYFFQCKALSAGSVIAEGGVILYFDETA